MRRAVIRKAALLVLACAAFLPACKKSDEHGQALMLVSAAASLREALFDSAKTFEAAHHGLRLQFSFEASSTLARQIEEGAAVDVFVSADRESLDRIKPRLDAATITPILSNQLALVAREDLAVKPTLPRDLVGKTGKLALAGPEVPAGKYARAYLQKAGLLADVTPRIVNGENARAALWLVQSGEADWGFVYRTDAIAAKKISLVWLCPPEDDPGIVYVAAVVARSQLPEARAYVAWLTSDEFQSAAEKLGFRRLK